MRSLKFSYRLWRDSNNIYEKTLSTICPCLSMVLIIYLPFQSLILSILQDKLQLSASPAFWITHWYEPVIILLLLLSIPNLVRGVTENSKTSRYARRIIYSAIALAAYGFISVIFFSPSISRGIEGFRFDLLSVLLFLLLTLASIEKDKIRYLVNTYLIMAFFIAGWAIVERFLPPNYWSSLGLAFHGYGYFGFGIAGETLNQSASFLGGPNQLGSYLLPAVFIALIKMSSSGLTRGSTKVETSHYARRILSWLAIMVFITAVFLSFSRSAWVGGFAGLLVYLVLFVKNFRLKYSLLGALAVILIGIFVAYKNIPAVKDILVHSSAVDSGASSQDSHNEALQQSMKELKSRNSTDLILGSGIGTAGPAAIKYSDGIVSESWYMQLMLELGIVGLALWVIFIIGLLIKYFRTHRGLFLGILAVSIAAFFLHTWADNPAVALTLFLLIGTSWQSAVNKPLTD